MGYFLPFGDSLFVSTFCSKSGFNLIIFIWLSCFLSEFTFGSSPFHPVSVMSSLRTCRDSTFCYCQNCGYKTKTLTSGSTERSDAALDIPALNDRLEIAKFSTSTSYSKQKSSLQKELSRCSLLFLSQLKGISTATPRELCRFLV